MSWLLGLAKQNPWIYFEASLHCALFIMLVIKWSTVEVIPVTSAPTFPTIYPPTSQPTKIPPTTQPTYTPTALPTIAPSTGAPTLHPVSTFRPTAATSQPTSTPSLEQMVTSAPTQTTATPEWVILQFFDSSSCGGSTNTAEVHRLNHCFSPNNQSPYYTAIYFSSDSLVYFLTFSDANCQNYIQTLSRYTVNICKPQSSGSGTYMIAISYSSSSTMSFGGNAGLIFRYVNLTKLIIHKTSRLFFN